MLQIPQEQPNLIVWCKDMEKLHMGWGDYLLMLTKEFNFGGYFSCWKNAKPTPEFEGNILRLRQNGHHFAENIFKCILLNENVVIFTESHSQLINHWFRLWLGTKHVIWNDVGLVY